MNNNNSNDINDNINKIIAATYIGLALCQALFSVLYMY